MSELIIATKSGNIQKVRELIEAGVDLNINPGVGEGSALTTASNFGHTEIVKLLIEAGADIDIKNVYGSTPLIMAIRRKNKEIVKLLIEAGADPNYKKWGETALLLSTRYRRRDFIRLLIEAGADLNVNNGEALHKPLVQKIYSEYIVSKVKKLQAKQRLAFATMFIDPKHEDKPNDIIIQILKEVKIPNVVNKPLLDKTNELLTKALQEELSKEIEQSLKKKFSGEKLDDMIEFYREQLRKPGLPKNIRKAYKKQKRTRKKKMGVTLGSSDLSSISKSKSKSKSKSNSQSKSKSKSKSMNSSEELKIELEMSIQEAKPVKSKSKTKSQSKQSGKSKKYCPPEKVQECISQGKVCNEFTGRCVNPPSDHFGFTKMFKDPPGYQGSKRKNNSQKRKNLKRK